jgi:uncharacterized protein
MDTDQNGMAVLTRRECFRLLGRNGIGRVGLSINALPAILPVMYAVQDGAIYFRTSTGAKLTAAAENAIVAFEVDEHESIGHTGWSVLIVGRAERVWESANATPLPLLRWVGRGGGDVLVRISPELVSGRRIDTCDARVVARQESEAVNA